MCVCMHASVCVPVSVQVSMCVYVCAWLFLIICKSEWLLFTAPCSGLPGHPEALFWLFILILQPTVTHGLRATMEFYSRMAPPSFWTTPVGHPGSLSCGMSLILDSPFMVTSTLPYTALFPKGLGAWLSHVGQLRVGTPCQAFPSPAISCPAVSCPQKSPNASLSYRCCRVVGPR